MRMSGNGDPGPAERVGDDTHARFVWSREREPHAQRRREMLQRYPQIKTLYGPCPRTKYVCGALVVVQLACAYFLKGAPWWLIVLVAYSFGGGKTA
jgi:sphingolipid delta-4 desaturase